MSIDYVNLPDRKLTNNFWLYEFLRSKTAADERIDNTPDPDQLEAITETARHLQSLRDWLPSIFLETVYIEITSGFRSEALNKAVGGSETSDHRTGAAADVRFRRKSGGYIDPARVARSILFDRYRRFDQIILYPGQRRFHIGYGARMRREVRHKTRGGYRFGFPAA